MMGRPRGPGGLVVATERATLDLVQAAIEGDRAALERVIEAWLPVLYGWCRRLGAGRVDPEEAAHDVIMTLVGRIGSLERPHQLPTWLFSTCQRVVANHRRRAWLRRWLPGVSLEGRPAPERTDAASDRRELAQHVERLLDRLPVRQREVLVLCYIEERSVAEAAELLQVPAGTVKSRLFHARAAFRKHYEREAR